MLSDYICWRERERERERERAVLDTHTHTHTHTQTQSLGKWYSKNKNLIHQYSIIFPVTLNIQAVQILFWPDLVCGKKKGFFQASASQIFSIRAAILEPKFGPSSDSYKTALENLLILTQRMESLRLKIYKQFASYIKSSHWLLKWYTCFRKPPC